MPGWPPATQSSGRLIDRDGQKRHLSTWLWLRGTGNCTMQLHLQDQQARLAQQPGVLPLRRSSCAPVVHHIADPK